MSAHRPIRRLLVANRGEIAVRIIRTARDMGIPSVAVYTDPDAASLHVDLADEAHRIGAAPSAHLDADALLAAARVGGADAVHPGYGFLSEDPAFARAVADAGLTWVGPRADAIEALGDKIRARALAVDVGAPVIPGDALDADPGAARDRVLSFAADEGYPVLIKRADSGGGRGITRLDDEDAARRYFRDLPDGASMLGCFVEKAVLRARHVETQCARAADGGFRVVSTRDCSVQRRNQKVVEEAPAPHLPAGVEDLLASSSRALFDAVDYVGAGTCEFLVDPSGRAYFLEVNPRLQVEHTVSEEIVGIDLVREQLLLAQGAPLTEPLPTRGHALEVRITSEDPADSLMPTTGTIRSMTWPGGPGVRIDSFVRAGDAIGAGFDSLIAKLVVWAPTRDQALARLRRAIDEVEVQGLATPAPLLSRIVSHPDFTGPDTPGAASRPDGPDCGLRVHTTWLEDIGLLDEVAADTAGLARPAPDPREPVGARSVDLPTEELVIEIDGRRTRLRVPSRLLGAVPADPGAVRRQPTRRHRARAAHASDSSTDVLAPIQGTVVRIALGEGDALAQGDLAVVLESMKMEKPVYAPVAGTASSIRVAVGDTVHPGDVLVAIDPEERP
ncbi:ATP-grasp domain-containing protein [Actinomyces sp. B33]|uniref:ATP-binding protein n=1 Tax=Actinomyces sp. B33 TaxID=2942131 RepID=UPI00233FA65E|nr:biotin carboxylase N-terminal domain-containing protein [Actinomyces sp. B33]MDC4232391.1 ATP-grasp domain-containing protein [Actinomyces sp. B33]